MDTHRMKAILVFVAALAFVTAPLWSGDFGGFDPGLYPVPQVEPPAQPAGYAFSIWGPIYLWLVVCAGFGLFARSGAADWDRHRWPLFLSLGVGAGWLRVAQVSPVMATVLIWLMLGAALLALARVPGRDRWLAAEPLGLYAGWLTAASCVSLALVGAGYGIGMGPVGWALAALALAAAIAAAVLRRLTCRAGYAAGVVWAFIAVGVQNLSSQPLLAGLAVTAAGLLAMLAVRGGPQASRSTHTGT